MCARARAYGKPLLWWVAGDTRHALLRSVLKRLLRDVCDEVGGRRGFERCDAGVWGRDRTGGRCRLVEDCFEMTAEGVTLRECVVTLCFWWVAGWCGTHALAGGCVEECFETTAEGCA